MNLYHEPGKDLPVTASVDVLVIGSGPAGFSAAVNCGRLGLDVMLIEQSGIIGGVAVSGLMSHWTGQTEGPFYEELLAKAASATKDYHYAPGKILPHTHIIDTEKTELVMIGMLQDAHVKTLLYTFASAPIMDGEKVVGCIIENKQGRQVVYARIVIDASGDGDIAAKAGVPFHLGRESDGKMQPVTLMFRVGGVDMEHAIFPGEFEDNIQDIQTVGKKYFKDKNLGHVLLYPGAHPGEVTVNMTNCVGVNPLDAQEISEAEFVCRKQIPEIITFLRKFVPGYSRCYWLETAPILGVRESRHFEGEYTITAEDITSGKVFPDWIVTRAFFNFDIHGLDLPGLDPTGDQSSFNGKPKYTIPLRCFVPKKINGLLLAGRNISGTHVAHSNYRVMPICMNMGQGVAAVCAVALANGVEPRAASIEKVHAILKKQGVRV